MIIYDVYRNTDLTEGRGIMVFDKRFYNEDQAQDYADHAPRYNKNDGLWEVRQVEIEGISKAQLQEVIDTLEKMAHRAEDAADRRQVMGMDCNLQNGQALGMQAAVALLHEILGDQD